MKTITIRVTREEYKEACRLVDFCFGSASPWYRVDDFAEDAFSDSLKILRRKANSAAQKALARMSAEPVNLIDFPGKGGAR